jgi:hypothetical protein
MKRILNRILIIEGFILVCLLFSGCTALRYADIHPDGTKRTFCYGSVEVFRERNFYGEYTPTNGVQVGVLRKNTLTPELVDSLGEAVGKGVAGGLAGGI